MDDFLSQDEISGLVSIADKAMEHGLAEGGPCIFDLVSGAVTYKSQFLSVYQKLAALQYIPRPISLTTRVPK
jgi:hypothetical protein